MDCDCGVKCMVGFWCLLWTYVLVGYGYAVVFVVLFVASGLLVVVCGGWYAVVNCLWCGLLFIVWWLDVARFVCCGCGLLVV